ncbi:aminoacyl-tRNA hydrolase [Nakamurella endophytica]|uniref:peptidyl-tRNA hydrolase n=1 Tax=Nakamurella endophytica TaxID=1748367 RepID=A0A917T2A4_9ACTN|nr:aminoacyl-tRNA hydrolase [Nakamurella endophytica]GGM07354.1 hypothetical protein GCM10011594_29190 [Nakamurella endophytica]
MTTGAVLAPLRARYARWLGMDADQVLDDRDEAAVDVRALQLVLRLERDRPPSWHGALALAAAGAALVCLDPRSEPGGPWHDAVRDYCAGHIRKVTRRARGASWAGTADLPGVSLAAGDTEIRALVPGRVVEVPKAVAKLQVGGTEVEPDRPSSAPDDPAALELWLPLEPVMTLGKAMAQAGHAGMIAAALLAGDDPAELDRWYAAGCPVQVRGRSERFAGLAARLADPAAAWSGDRLLAVRDAGFTEVDPGTVTVVARAPGGRPHPGPSTA